MIHPTARLPLLTLLAMGLAAGGPTPPGASAAELFVSPDGSDGHPGTLAEPFATIPRARDAARALRGEPVTVYLRGGVYYLAAPVVFGPEDSGGTDRPIVYCPYRDEHVVVSGGERLRLDFRPFEGPVVQAVVPAGFSTDQLFIDGERQPMARYPNFDPEARRLGGSVADCVSRERASRWKDPRGGYFHAMHEAHWGDMHYVITGKDSAGDVTYEGGWQNNRPSRPHAEHRFVENIFEELDAPGEWFLDRGRRLLYLIPPQGCDLETAKVEAVRLEQLFEFRGEASSPVRFIELRGLTLTHTARTFMKNREPLVRSDWTTWRGGAVFLEGAEGCRLRDLTLLDVGSNAIFVSGYNRDLELSGCHIARAGASSISFVGRPQALRSPHFRYEETSPLEALDPMPGPRGEEYPARCVVEDCLLTSNGRFEKQTAGVNICTAEEITVRACSIYDVPRAGINICDGAFGGHLIEGCDVFDTVKETGDHGAFNSWGRDRFWNPSQGVTEGWMEKTPGMARWDARKTTVLRRNRWRCDLGWDIDLDDGSSNYRIYENLCLSGGIKLREGYHRVVENNILVNNTFHPHVWYRECDTVFRRNIVFAPYAPAGMRAEAYGAGIDQNLLHIVGAPETRAEALSRISGADGGSLSGDALFVSEAACDYRVQDASPARKVGFVSFDTSAYGVRSGRLRSIARTPILPGSPEEAAIVNRGWGQSVVLSPHKESRRTRWLGAVIRNIRTEADKLAAGLDGVRGVLVLEVAPGALAGRLGLKVGDVILSLDERGGEARGEEGRIDDVQTLIERWKARPPEQRLRLGVWRDQQAKTLEEGR